MTFWREDYLSALQERDRRELAERPLYLAYTKLADRVATAEQKAKSNTILSSQSERLSAPTAKLSTKSSPNASSDKETLALMQSDLAEAQRSKSVLQARLQKVTDDLQKLSAQSLLDRRRMAELSSDKANTTLRMRDQDEELKGKTKLLEDIHDETVSLTLQLNMAEEQSQKLRQENKDLVDRWMARMGKEADAMNEASRFA